MEAEARDLMRKVYRPMVEAGASTRWEEWGPNSSHCHMWGSFVADFLMER
jgi:hypothetical protein